MVVLAEGIDCSSREAGRRKGGAGCEDVESYYELSRRGGANACRTATSGGEVHASCCFKAAVKVVRLDCARKPAEPQVSAFIILTANICNGDSVDDSRSCDWTLHQVAIVSTKGLSHHHLLVGNLIDPHP